MPGVSISSCATRSLATATARGSRRLLATAILVLLPVTGLSQQDSMESGTGTIHLVPGNSSHGLQVFQDKGCSICHQGRTSDSGPGPSSQIDQPLTESELAARLWNHGPMMWEFMRSQGQTPPLLSTREMSDLFAFLIQTSHAGEPGNAGLGELLFRKKGCGNCHLPHSASGARAPAIQYWGAHSSPLSLARAMWNHADGMWAHVQESGQSWPRLLGSELTHIVTYVRRINTVTGFGEIVLGSPARGRQLYAARGCLDCHAEKDRNERAWEGPGTLADLAAAMWSHYPDMAAALDGREPLWTHLSAGEMADLAAYLFAEGHLEGPGDPAHGEDVFKEKLCAYCHAGRSPVGGRLEQVLRRATSAEFACAMWNHGPRMADWMREKSVKWPEMNRRDILDLLAFLSRAE